MVKVLFILCFGKVYSFRYFHIIIVFKNLFLLNIDVPYFVTLDVTSYDHFPPSLILTFPFKNDDLYIKANDNLLVVIFNHLGPCVHMLVSLTSG